MRWLRPFGKVLLPLAWTVSDGNGRGLDQLHGYGAQPFGIRHKVLELERTVGRLLLKVV
jgi:hypothetical protein